MTLTAVLFAGGESRRMGSDKATLVFRGEPLWARQLRTLREMKPAQILISARTVPVWCPPDIATVLDEVPACGPLGGLAAVLGRVETTHLLALAIDMPLITTGHLEKLVLLAHPACGIVPKTGGKLEPLCAVYPVEARDAARGALAGEGASMHGFIRFLADQGRMQFHATAGSEVQFYRNLNTPSELSNAVRALEGD